MKKNYFVDTLFKYLYINLRCTILEIRCTPEKVLKLRTKRCLVIILILYLKNYLLTMSYLFIMKLNCHILIIINFTRAW